MSVSIGIDFGTTVRAGYLSGSGRGFTPLLIEEQHLQVQAPSFEQNNLDKFFSSLKKQVPEGPAKVIVATSVEANDADKAALIKAAGHAGFSDVQLIITPIASALSESVRMKTMKSSNLVIECTNEGARVSIVKSDGQKLELIGSEKSVHLGNESRT